MPNLDHQPPCTPTANHKPKRHLQVREQVVEHPRTNGARICSVCLIYLLLAYLLTWPTVTHIATHLPGDGGTIRQSPGTSGGPKHALLDLKTNPLFTDYMFYPIGINLAFYTLTVLNALTALPLPTLNLGVVSASNIHMLFTLS